MDIDAAAALLKLPVKSLEQWEREGVTLSFTRAEKVADAYRIPIAGLLFPSALQDPPLPVDRRTMASQAQWRLSTETVLVVRFAQAVQESIRELAELNEQELRATPKLVLDASPVDAAARFREILGVSLQQQAGYGSARAALPEWIGRVEAMGVHVLHRRWNVSEGRAFSLSGPAPVIVLNDSDKESALLFSLFHELAHVVLGEGGICDTAHSGYDDADRVVEVFCNAFAANLLVPSKSLLDHRVVRGHGGMTWKDDSLRRVAKDFAVSRETVLRRLLTLNRTTPEFYEMERERYAAEYAEFMKRLAAARKKRAGGPKWPARVVHNHGERYSREVIVAFDRGRLSAAEAGMYLGTTPRHIDAIRDQLA